jgi:hypothetical protein
MNNIDQLSKQIRVSYFTYEKWKLFMSDLETKGMKSQYILGTQYRMYNNKKKLETFIQRSLNSDSKPCFWKTGDCTAESVKPIFVIIAGHFSIPSTCNP